MLLIREASPSAAMTATPQEGEMHIYISHEIASKTKGWEILWEAARGLKRVLP